MSAGPAALIIAALACTLVVSGAAAADESDSPLAEPVRATVWEGAIGFNARYQPEYSGSSQQVAKITPALFLRYGRFTITNASGFVTRRADDVVRGLGIDFANNERLRVNLALRFDAGRSEGTSTALSGVGDIKPTVRTRLNLGWRFPGPWRVGGSWSVDALGRGGGHFGDIGGGWEQRVSPATVLSAGAFVSVAGDRYMQTYYGINDAQAARTGYAVYKPASGLRDAGLNLGLRMDLGDDWILLSGASATRLLGPAARSPLTGKRNGWSLSTGLAWRF